MRPTTAPTTAPATRPAVTLGKDTTRITRPLKPNGLPDYAAAIEEQCSRGVTPENNAAVLVAQAIGPEMFNQSVRAAGFQKLGIELPKGPFPNVSFKDSKEENACMKVGHLKPSEHKAISAWVEANRKTLDLIVAAGCRSRWYVPIPTISPGEPMKKAMLPNLLPMMGLSRMLSIRAKFAAAEGRMDACRKDLLALERLGALMDQDPSLIARMVGFGLSGMAYECYVTLATSGDLDAKTAEAMLAEAQSVLSPSVISSIDQFERFMNLDMICWFSAAPAKELAAEWADTIDIRMGMLDGPRHDPKLTEKDIQAMAAGARATDWNATLRRCNSYFDHMVAAMRGELRGWNPDKDKPPPPATPPVRAL